MTYNLITRDKVVTIKNIPDNIDANGDAMKLRVAKEREKLKNTSSINVSPTIENAEFNASGGYDSIENQQRLTAKQFSGVKDADVLARPTKYNPTAELVRNMTGTVAFEFGDEIEAKVMSAIGQADYDTYVSQLRDKQIQYRADRPTEAILTGILAGIFTGVAITKIPKVGKWLMANKNSSTAKRIMKLMGIGGTGGAVAGAGAYDPTRGDTSLAGSMAIYGLGGALVPPLLIGGGKTIGATYRGVKNLFRNLGITEGNPQKEAFERIAQTLSQKDISPQEIQKQLIEARRLGLNDIQIAELESGMTKLGRQSMSINSQSSDIVPDNFAQSKEIFTENIQKRLNKAMGIEGIEIDSSYLFKINQKQYAEAKKLYPEAYKQTISRLNFKINDVDIFNQKLIKQAWDSYVNKMKNLSIIGEKNPTWAQLKKMKEIPTEYLHKIKMGLDDIIEDNTDITGKANPVARKVKESKDLFDDITRKFNKTYSEANDKFSDAFQIKDAFNKGKKYNLIDSAEMKRTIKNMNSGEREAYKSGVLNSIYNLIHKGQDAARVAFGSPRKRDALKLLFKTEKEFLDFEKMIKYQIKRKAAQFEISGGSKTQRTSVQDDLDNLADNADNKGFIMSVFAKLSKSVGMSQDVAEVLKKDLLLATPSRQKIIIKKVLDTYEAELNKRKMFDLIKSGTTGTGILSNPNILETIVKPHLTTNDNNKLKESGLLGFNPNPILFPGVL